MKKQLPRLLLLCLLMSACGLRSPADTSRPEQEVPATSSSMASSPASTPVPVVIRNAFCQTGNYSDDVGNNWDYVLRIPMIETKGEDALRLNRELYDAMYPAVTDALDSMAGAYSLGVYRVDYTVYVHEQLVSILCEIDTNWGFDSYYTVNFDAAGYVEVKRSELLQRFVMTEESFPVKAAELVDAYFREEYSSVPQNELYRDRHEKASIRPIFWRIAPST